MVASTAMMSPPSTLLLQPKTIYGQQTIDLNHPVVNSAEITEAIFL